MENSIKFVSRRRQEVMKILLLHLSDAHIRGKNDVNLTKIQRLVDSLSIINFDECVLIFSGDLAMRGLTNEYKHIKHLFGSIISRIKEKYYVSEIQTLVVPGNHDVNQINNPKTRQQINDMLKSGALDDEIEVELGKMKAFFEFANHNRCFIDHKIVDKRELQFNGYRIGVNLINSAIYSILKDERGIHYFPEKYLEDLDWDEEFDLNIGIIHHGPDWFMPDNKNNLERVLYKNSSLLFIGHEHDNQEFNIEIDNHKVDVIRGGTFRDSKNNKISEYYAITIDTETNKYDTYFFSWDKDARFYQHELQSRKKKVPNVGLQPLESFVDQLAVDTKRTLSNNFTDYFVFPGLEKESKELYATEYEIHEYNDLINEIENKKKIIIFGNENSGKTTMLKKLYLSLCKDKLPLFFNIEDIKNKRVDKMIKNAFEEQYSENPIEFSRYEQLEKKYKVAIVDDINFIDKNQIKGFIISLCNEFKYVIFGSKKGWNFDIKSEAKEEIEIFRAFQRYNIVEFYSGKRVKLIEKVCEINLSNSESDVNVKEMARKIDRFIHNQIKLFTLNPDFIIQYTTYFCNDNGLYYSSDSKVFSKVFESNITRSLEKHTERGRVDKIFTLLDKVAYYIHFNKEYPLGLEKFKRIIEDYNEEYDQVDKPKEVLDIVCNAKIMKYVDGTFNIKFTNNNYLAYFVARELLKQYNNESNLANLDYILKNICFGINSDIVLFISYLSSNLRVLKYFYENTKDYMQDWEELSIDKGNIDFLKTIKSDLVNLPNKEDKEKISKLTVEQEKDLIYNEKIHTTDIYNYDEDSLDLLTNKLSKSLKYTQIISKILPSFEHLLKKEEKNEFVTSVYSFPNKILYCWLKDIDKNKKDIINEICRLIEENQQLNDKKAIREKAICFLDDVVTASILSIYDYISNLATNSITIRYLENFNYADNTNYKIQNLLMYETLNDIDEIVKRFHDLCDSKSKPVAKLMAKKIVRKYLIIHGDELHPNKKQKLIGKHFSNKQQKYLLMEEVSKRAN